MPVISSMLAAILLGLIIRYFPYRIKEGDAKVDFKGMESKYDKWETMAMIPFFIFTPTLAYMFADLAFNIFHTLDMKDKTAVFQLTPQYKYWFIPGSILSIAVVFYPMKALYKMLLKTEYDNYMLYTDIKHGYKGVKTMKLVTWTLGPVAIISFLLMMDYSFNIYKDKMAFNGLFKLSPTHYNYQQVKSIRYILKTRDKKDKAILHNTPHYEIEFTDRHIWESESALSNERVNPSVAMYISVNSRIKIDTLQTYP